MTSDHTPTTPQKFRTFTEAFKQVIDLTSDTEDEEHIELLEDKRKALSSLSSANIFAHLYDASTTNLASEKRIVHNEQRTSKKRKISEQSEIIVVDDEEDDNHSALHGRFSREKRKDRRNQQYKPISASQFHAKIKQSLVGAENFYVAYDDDNSWNKAGLTIMDKQFKTFVEEGLPRVLDAFFANDIDCERDMLSKSIFVALHHPSWTSDAKQLMAFKTVLSTEDENYERLEFLGDGILKTAIVARIISNRDEKSQLLTPHAMTNATGFLVSNRTICQILMMMHLDDLIVHSKNKGLSFKDVADVFEALIGAFFLAAGLDKTVIIIQKVYDWVVDQGDIK
jgi:dsRNA-specific ribonuclease